VCSLYIGVSGGRSQPGRYERQGGFEVLLYSPFGTVSGGFERLAGAPGSGPRSVRRPTPDGS